MTRTPFGRETRELFAFDADYTPLNHGSYGAYPKHIRDRQRHLQDLTESRSDPFIRYTIPKLLLEARDAIAPLLGASREEVVFTPNATTGINTVLRNLAFQDGDIILYCNTAYGACEKTILHVCETTPARSLRIDVTFPMEDDELVEIFRQTIKGNNRESSRVRIAMFDTVATFPGIRLPWEALVRCCRDLNVLSLIDGAHGIGHIDLKEIHGVQPDFFTSNCYKWLYTPRACAMLYVPRRNQYLIRSTFPTSHGFKPMSTYDDGSADGQADDGLGDLFAWAATIDMSPYLCATDALKLRLEALGGEESIRDYCFNLARTAGAAMAKVLRTEVMDNRSGTLSQCCFSMVRLPLHFKPPTNSHSSITKASFERQRLPPEHGPVIVKWIMEKLMTDHDTWIPGKFYNGEAWMRISAQAYLELSDFEWAAGVLLKLCADVEARTWSESQP